MNLIARSRNTKLDFKIALDGPAASGKGLIGLMLSKEFNLQYIQSSIVYRGLALLCVENQIALDNREAIISTAKNKFLISRIKHMDLHTELIGEIASQIATIEDVRLVLNRYLTNWINYIPRIVMEGRDIGTFIAPNADIKIFINANVEVRAMRRYKQLQLERKDCILDDVLEQLKKRDIRDIKRSAAPLKSADNALIIDTSYLQPSEVILKIKQFIYR